ncbi:hypothetical protein [Embleya scabrispora]|uniref:hypothetical protein n=1 Tax=Embleya scabrispora TaxID=159449 RepID=UPI00036EA4FC|nr:hypothetical protein [Embleya scabrispora]MYS78888.1 hypothetical protein [Streptomyces sp. SID5474]
MRRYAAFEDTALTLTLAPVPSVVNVSTPKKPQLLALELTVRGRAEAPVYLDRIDIAIPHGPGASELTTTAVASIKDGTDYETPPDQGWSAEASLVGGIATVSFTNRRGVYADGDFAVTMILYDFHVNEEVGTAEIVVDEWTSPKEDDETTRRTTRFPIDKWPADFTFANFRPDDATVRNGETVMLRWERSRGPKYTMYWDGGSEDVTARSSWPSKKLYHTTGFMLVAVDGEGAGRRTYALTTAVTVTEPNLLVGNLDVNGITQLQGPRQQFPLPASGTSQYYRAATDGTLVGYLSGRSGAPSSTLAATVYRAGANEYTMRFSSENPAATPPRETPISVPVPQDAEVLLYFGGQSGDTLDLVWLPQGTGGFEVMSR